MNKNKKYRQVDGILLVDKPKNMTSNHTLQKIKRRFSANKAGHSGTLDPMATGLLPICFGEATKFSTNLLDANKEYLFECTLGIKTDTGDAHGKIIEVVEKIPTLTEIKIIEVFKSFQGNVKQIPPMVSALWHNGNRLYDLAREGIEIERAPREIQIFSLELISCKNDCFIAKVKCSKGTYIRVLAEDIAHKLGTIGHLTMLKRTYIDPFENQKIYSFEEIMDENLSLHALDKYLLPVESALETFPSITLSCEFTKRFMQGQRIRFDSDLINQFYRVYSDQNLFLGTATVENNLISPKRIRVIDYY